MAAKIRVRISDSGPSLPFVVDESAPADMILVVERGPSVPIRSNDTLHTSVVYKGRIARIAVPR